MSFITELIGNVANIPSFTSTENKTGEIYRIWFVNDPSGKSYIGQTVQGSHARIKQHIADASNKNDASGCPLLDDATRRFGVHNMRYEILEQGITTYEELDEAEKYWIKRFDSRTPNGYNVKSGGQGKKRTVIGEKKETSGGMFSIYDIIPVAGVSNKRRSAGAWQPIVGYIVDEAIERSELSETAKGRIRSFIR